LQERAKSSITDDDARKFLEHEPKEQEAAPEDDIDADDLV